MRVHNTIHFPHDIFCQCFFKTIWVACNVPPTLQLSVFVYLRNLLNSLKTNIINVCKSAQIDIESASLFNRDVVEFLKNEKITFDIIFLDPPYHLFSNIGKIRKPSFKSERRFEVSNTVEFRQAGFFRILR